MSLYQALTAARLRAHGAMLDKLIVENDHEIARLRRRLKHHGMSRERAVQRHPDILPAPTLQNCEVRRSDAA